MAICGCYFIADTPGVNYYGGKREYLPLVGSEVTSTILSTTSSTVLKQTFTNPSSEAAIKECVYTFPLYDGVSVVNFTCRIGDKVLHGIVKEKVKAKEIFDKAVSRGETAGLLVQDAQASDVFSTKLGNIPKGEKVLVEITYVGELKHEGNGIRFTIPTKVAPRYGGSQRENSSNVAGDGGMKITVDVSMHDGTFIEGLSSPSHPISVSIGKLSTATKTTKSASNNASATLALGDTSLDQDFVLNVEVKDLGTPKAILETHPTISNHRALMVSLVPKFKLPPSRPEIIFVADRSGSMSGNIPSLISAMKVFLKSMPVGVKFNICSFGNGNSFLWPKSKAYSKESLDQASKHIETFDANMGGTETMAAIKATIEKRYGDIPLEIMLLTDGDIWDQEALFSYVNKQVRDSGGKIRIFPLGIGSGVSHALINGLARAGNGFAQAVQPGERLDAHVVRMLRASLSPHITDYSLEVKYSEDNDDFELIESVTDGLKVLLSDVGEPAKQESKEKANISLFDADVEMEDTVPEVEQPVVLPSVPVPKLLQAPHKIPSLFPGAGSVVYLLMSPETIQQNPTSVILRATSIHGPLELSIPIEILTIPAKTIHQLAAKKAVQDLEEGRGWIYDAKDQNGVLVKNRYPSQFDDLVKREAVRLGEQFQIANKWCSFVAVKDNGEENGEKEAAENEDKDEDEVYKLQRVSPPGLSPSSGRKYQSSNSDKSDRSVALPHTTSGYDKSYAHSMLPQSFRRSSHVAQARIAGGGLFGASSQVQPMMQNHPQEFSADESLYDLCVDSSSLSSASPTMPSNLSLASSPQLSSHKLGERKSFEKARYKKCSSFEAEWEEQDDQESVSPFFEVETDYSTVSNKVLALIGLQDFEGFWAPSDIVQLAKIMDIEKGKLEKGADEKEKKAWVTAIVLAFLEEKCGTEEDTWELVVEKGKSWLGDETLEKEAKAFWTAVA